MRSEPQWEGKSRAWKPAVTHVEERAAEGVVPKPLDAEQVAGWIELTENRCRVKKDFILDLLENHFHQA